MDTSRNFERRYVDHCAALVEGGPMTHSDFARRCWPQHGDPRGHWRSLRRHTCRLTMADAHTMAAMLGEDVAGLCWQVDK